MARKTLVVSFSPGEGPFDTPAWVDISSRVRSAEWTWGRQRDDQDFPPGEATITLSNHDRLFDPDNTSGTYTGLLLPRVPFRLQTDIGEDLFYGYVEDGWEQTYSHPEDGYCTVRLVDLMGVLEGYRLPGVFETAVLALNPAGYWPLTDSSAGVKDLGSLHNPGTPEENPTFGAPDLFPGLGPSIEFSGANQRIDVASSPLEIDIWHCTVMSVIATDTAAESGTFHTIFGQFDGNTPNIDVLSHYVASDGTARLEYVKGGTGFDVTSVVSVVDGDPHLIIAQANLGETTGYGVAVDSVTLSLTGTTPGAQGGHGVAIGGTPFAPRNYSEDYFPGRIGHVAVWDAVLTEAQRQTVVDALDCMDGQRSDQQIAWALDQIGVPAGSRSLDTGRSVMGPARTAGVDALDFIRKIARTEDGGFYVNHADGGKLRFVERYAPWTETRSSTSQATFSDDPAAAGVARVEPGTLVVEPNGIRSVINQATVKWVGGEETAEDATSVAAYGPRGRSIDTVASGPYQALSLAQWKASLQANPTTRVRGLGINPGADVSVFDVAVDTRVGDLVTFRSQPASTGSVVTRSLLVEGVTHRVEGLQWETAFYTSLTPADVVDLFILGTSTLDGAHVLGY